MAFCVSETCICGSTTTFKEDDPITDTYNAAKLHINTWRKHHACSQRVYQTANSDSADTITSDPDYHLRPS
jgi:hypothetical protein